MIHPMLLVTGRRCPPAGPLPAAPQSGNPQHPRTEGHSRTARATDSLAESLHAHITELGAAIIELARRRSELGAELVTCRRAAGRPAVELARENDVLQRYGAALGRPGTALAMILTEL